MARKSRKSSSNLVITVKDAAVLKSRAGIYMRLSVEDNGYGTRDSIQNQAAFLKEFIEYNADEFQLIQEYTDNGTTGTNFDRREWEHMLEDIKKGVINCIIVKDFSRIGRNYIEVGNYLEKIFPFLGVRVVSVNDNFDSSKKAFENDMLMNSLKNIVNEYYARDISKKITQVKKTMQKNGEYASGVPPYGYRKSSVDPKKFEGDPGCACVVKKIFAWRARGKGCSWIANYLNELALPSPGQYRYMNGNGSFRRCSNTIWKSKHVSGILTNPVYLGHMVQGKIRRSYFEQGGKPFRIPKDEWIIVENTHEPLATQEQFDIAVEMVENSRKRHLRQMNVNIDVPCLENPIRKKICCGQCGSMLTRRSRVQNKVRDYCYFCNAHERKHDARCVNTYIHEIPLMEAVRKAADQHMRLLGVFQSKWVRKNMMGDFEESSPIISDQKREIEEKLNLIKRQKQELYEGMRDGKFTLKVFTIERECLKGRQQQCEQELERIRHSEKEQKEIDETLNKYGQDASGINSIEIPVDLLDKLIEKIVVISPERIEITFSYTDMLRKWME